jgi:serine/threonine-protein kinase
MAEGAPVSSGVTEHLRPGDTFGRFTIEALLGEGGMGTVYRAVDTRLERRVALKLLRIHSNVPPDERTGGAERLLREARAAAALEHPNAIGIHEVGEVGDTPYIAMELVVGRTLRAYVGDVSVSLASRVDWLTDVARALAAAHARGLVHRDIKPDNVMVREDGKVKVLDFGIASLLPRAGATQPPPAVGGADAPPWYMTLARSTLAGTPRYMAPEQLRGELVDGRADQFAWGVMAYELLSGSPPWRGSNVSLTVLADVLENDPAPLRSAAPRVSPALERIVHRTLAKAVEDRFASMDALVAALEEASARGRGRTLRWAPWAALTIAVLAGGAALAIRRPAAPAQLASVAPTAAAGAPAPSVEADTSYEPPQFVLHLDAAQGVSESAGAVLRWSDQSGNDTDAYAPARRPTLVRDAIHGLPAIHFDGGAYLRVDDVATLHLGKHDFTVGLVARHDRPVGGGGLSTSYGITTGYGCLYAKSLLPSPYVGVAIFANWPRPRPTSRVSVQTQYEHHAVSTSEGLNDGRVHLYEARRVDTTLEIRIDGVVEARTEGADDDVSAEGVPIYLGAHVTDSGVVQQLRGDIAEVYVLRGGVTDARLREIEDALLARYGIARPEGAGDR